MGDAFPKKAGKCFAQTFAFLRRLLLFACFLCDVSYCYRLIFEVSWNVTHRSCADFCFRWQLLPEPVQAEACLEKIAQPAPTGVNTNRAPVAVG